MMGGVEARWWTLITWFSVSFFRGVEPEELKPENRGVPVWCGGWLHFTATEQNATIMASTNLLIHFMHISQTSHKTVLLLICFTAGTSHDF